MNREELIRNTIIARGVNDPFVLAAMRKVPREEFVPESQKRYAYADEPLPIGDRQTISQPYIVAFMTELLKVDNNSQRILEIGTGSGYQAAILAEIVKEVYSVEIIAELHLKASENLSRLGYKNVFTKCSDGYDGWPEHAPYDGIIITAAPHKVPENLINQLKVGGRMVLPVGEFWQELFVIKRKEKGYDTISSIGVRFVPMTGKIQFE